MTALFLQRVALFPIHAGMEDLKVPGVIGTTPGSRFDVVDLPAHFGVQSVGVSVHLVPVGGPSDKDRDLCPGPFWLYLRPRPSVFALP